VGLLSKLFSQINVEFVLYGGVFGDQVLLPLLQKDVSISLLEMKRKFVGKDGMASLTISLLPGMEPKNDEYEGFSKS
jgi:hypothetical protein